MVILRVWNCQLIDVSLGLAIWFYFALLLKLRSSRIKLKKVTDLKGSFGAQAK